MKLHIATRAIGNWRERLASPERQWKRGYSAFETAVSWEGAAGSCSGLPPAMEALLVKGGYPDPVLTLAVAEHQVSLPGGKAASQCDVWGLVRTSAGLVSLSVEAKASEPFGESCLSEWLAAGDSERSIANRRERWDYIRAHLPESDAFSGIRYQLLHRCAAAVIEARRFGLAHAAFVVQSFGAPEASVLEYSKLCVALGIVGRRGEMGSTAVSDIVLRVGWAECPLATDAEIAATA